MKVFFLYILLLLMVINCHKDTTGINVSEYQINFSTNKSLYTKSDTIEAKLTNNSDVNIIFETRSGYIVMYYQKRENYGWSKNLYFYFSSLRGPSISDTLKPNCSFTQTMRGDDFNSAGILRLVIDCIGIQDLTREINDCKIIYSNYFKVE